MVKLPKVPAKGMKTICFVCAAMCSAWVLPTLGGQSAGLFNVSVTIIPATVQLPLVIPVSPSIISPGLPISAFCTKDNLPTAHGAVVTVVCATGAVADVKPGRSGPSMMSMHGGAYRYVTHVTPTGTLLDTVDAFSGAGTTTAWRVVRSADWDYLEMTLGW